MAHVRHLAPAVLAMLTVVAGAVAQPASKPARPSLQQALAELKTPPGWFATTPVSWDTNRPWKDARLEIRRLLGGEEAQVRQAVKLTWIYRQKNDIGDGHEWPMYLFMSGQYAWSLREYEPFMRQQAGKGATHAYLCWASCYLHFGEYDRALAVLEQALRDLPKPPWTIMNQAQVLDALGDVYAAKGELDRARQCYQEAIRLLPTSNQPHGRHLLKRKTDKVQTKLDLLSMQSLAQATLRDGVYMGTSIGYIDKAEMVITVTVRDGRIADVQVKHQEDIELGATKIIPQRIVEQQSLRVDAVTGATTTSEAIIDGAYKALRQAGLK